MYSRSRLGGRRACRVTLFNALRLALLTIMPPVLINPEAYNNAPPPGIWMGLVMLVFPLGFMALTTLYGLVGAVRSLGGHDFRYAGVGNWLESRS